MTSKRLLPLVAALALMWGCASDPTGPSTGQREPSWSSAAATTYRVRNLGSLGGISSLAFAINDANVVVGTSATGPVGVSHAFVWKNGVMTDLGTLTGGTWSEARGINNDGVIVGWSFNRAGDMKAIRWMNGIRRNLGTLGGRNSQALAISPTGVIVGWAEVAGGQRHAFRWENGIMSDLGTLPGGNSSAAADINRGGAIVGSSTTASGETHAFRWKDGVFTDLGTQGTQSSAATAINTLGQIAGVTGPPPDAAGSELDIQDGFMFYRDVWDRSVGFGHQREVVNDISPTGIIVGLSEDPRDEDPNYAEQPWYWENGVNTFLPRLNPGHSGAYGVNRAGNIVGYGTSSTGRIRAVMWTRVGG